ncbi:DUF1905 domain-containing protein [Nakamurella flavida]|uniref:DUF1905 domain-containing protein n=1 Tax=Nakamurella flavida TaxID=363630 RepID=A0A939BZA9_9ACTN|nr:YdeI/OmpD-associated family protein [Nakamurella flavida]MBM9475543.1 DUF1905 domain-containing protein [Nakamurella flavida]MDP9778182.1 hypothetical protein [Nakamurella flavida]
MATVRTFTTTLLQQGNNVGIEVPPDVVESFDAGRRVPVRVSLRDHRYDSTIAVMGGRFLVPVSAAHRAAAGVAGGDEVSVTLEHDPQPRTVDVPADLADALTSAGVREAFDALPAGGRKGHVRSVTEAKADATRARRIAKVVDQLGG